MKKRAGRSEPIEVRGKPVSETILRGGRGPEVGGYVLTHDQGKAVQEILRRYVGEELEPELSAFTAIGEDEAVAAVQKDIDYIEQLSKLFD